MYIVINCEWHTVGYDTKLQLTKSKFTLWSRLSCSEQPSEYWYSGTALPCGILHSNFALRCLICKESRWEPSLKKKFHHLVCVSADFVWFMKPTESLLARLQIYGFEWGTIGAVAIALTPHSFCRWRASRVVRYGTPAKVLWLAIRHSVNWNVNIKSERKRGQ